MKNFLFIIFTAVYFYLFCQLVDLLFRSSGPNFVLDLLTIVCWIVSFVASIGFADYTVKKIEEHFRK